jgi:uncharacterized protein
MTSTTQSNFNAKQVTKLVSCPTCKKLSTYNTNNPFRPFCSERCKMIDLGDWANENYRIPDNKPSGADDDFD